MIDDLIHRLDVGEQLSNHTNEPRQAEPASELPDPTLWGDRVRDALAQRSDTALDIAETLFAPARANSNSCCLPRLRPWQQVTQCARTRSSNATRSAMCPAKPSSLLTALAYARRDNSAEPLGDATCARGSSLFLRPCAGSSALVHVALAA